MILSEREMELGEDARRHRGARHRCRAPGRRWPRCLPIAEAVLELEITPNRPDCLGVYGVAREVHAITGAELAPPPWDVDAEAARRRATVAGLASVDVEVPDLCPRFTARAFTDVDDRALAALAQGAADRRRPAPDQQRRRHHQLRDAADRPAAARVRPRRGPGRRDHRPRRGRGRADDDARRRRARARPRDGARL